MENILSGNPLLNLTGPSQPQANFKVKRRYFTQPSWMYIADCAFYAKLLYKASKKPLFIDNNSPADTRIMEEAE